jgi:biotin operon repressor
MFDYSLCPGDVLQQITGLSRQLVAAHLEKLCRLGYERDV